MKHKTWLRRSCISVGDRRRIGIDLGGSGGLCGGVGKSGGLLYENLEDDVW